MGGIVCAKYILCNPPAVARAENRRRLAEVKAENDERLKCAMLEGLGDITDIIKEYGPLSEKQMQCYHALAAVLDKDERTFDAAYDALRQSLIVSG